MIRGPGGTGNTNDVAQLRRAQEEIQARAEKLRGPQTKEIRRENEQMFRDAAETERKYQYGNSLAQINPWHQAQLSEREYQLHQASFGNSELAHEIQTNSASIRQLLVAEQRGVSFEELRNYVVSQGAHLLLQGDLGGFTQLSATLAGLESAQRVLGDYDQAARSIPSYQRPKDAQPVKSALRQGIDELRQQVRDIMDGLRGKKDAKPAEEKKAEAASPPPKKPPEAAAPKKAAKPPPPPSFAPTAPKTRDLSFEQVVSKGGVKEPVFSAAEDAARALFGAGQKKATFYLFDRKVSDDRILATALDQIAGLQKDVGFGKLEDKDRMAELRRAGVFFGAGDHDAEAKTAFAGKPQRAVIKAELDVDQWPPRVTVRRMDLA